MRGPEPGSAFWSTATAKRTTLPVKLLLNVSRSAPRGIYLAVATAPARSAFVVACLPPEVAVIGRARGYLGPGDCPGSTQPVLKRVGALPGDILELDDLGVTVNGQRVLARPIEVRDSAGRILPHAAFGSHVVAAEEVWLFGSSSARSWDSRYFGPVPLASVRGVVRPMLTVD